MSETSITEYKPLNLKTVIKKAKPSVAKYIPGFVYRYLNKILHIDQINEFAAKHINDSAPDFLKALVDYFNVGLIWEGRGYEELKKNTNRSYMVVSNHPFGGPEAGVIFNQLIRDYPDMKLVAQAVMKYIKPFQSCCVFNKSEVRTLMEHVEEKKSLLIYPAGYCSRLLSFGEVFDYEWKPSFVKIAKKNNMPITVVFVKGQLSKRMINWTKFRNFFHIKASIETIYLVDELFKMSGSSVTMVVGKTITPEMLSDSSVDNIEWAARIRQYCYELGKNPNLEFDPSKKATLPLK